MNYDVGSDSFAMLDEQQVKLMRRRWTQWDSGRSNRKWHRKGLCPFCQSHKATTLDHIIPRTMWNGADLRNDPMNWVGACYECNQAKGDRHFLFFFAWRQGRPVHGVSRKNQVRWQMRV